MRRLLLSLSSFLLVGLVMGQLGVRNVYAQAGCVQISVTDLSSVNRLPDVQDTLTVQVMARNLCGEDFTGGRIFAHFQLDTGETAWFINPNAVLDIGDFPSGSIQSATLSTGIQAGPRCLVRENIIVQGTFQDSSGVEQGTGETQTLGLGGIGAFISGSTKDESGNLIGNVTVQISGGENSGTTTSSASSGFYYLRRLNCNDTYTLVAYTSDGTLRSDPVTLNIVSDNLCNGQGRRVDLTLRPIPIPPTPTPTTAPLVCTNPCTYSQSCTTSTGQAGTQSCTGVTGPNSSNPTGACGFDTSRACDPNCTVCTAGPTLTPSLVDTSTCTEVSFNTSPILVGQNYTATVKMSNDGTTTWTSAANYRLAARDPLDDPNWGTSTGADSQKGTRPTRVTLPSSISPGSTAIFNFGVTAPDTAGDYRFAYQMIIEGVTEFGWRCGPNITVQAPLTPSPTPTPTPTATPTRTPTPTLTPTPVPGAPSVSVTPICFPSTGYTGTGISISWTAGGVSYVDIDDESAFNLNFYHKDVSGFTSTTAPSGFNLYCGATSCSGALTLYPGITYWARTFNGTNSPGTSFSRGTCTTPTPTPTTAPGTPTPTRTPTPTPGGPTPTPGGPTPTPSSSCPWIQTIGGDVHSNTIIKTTCP